jgi:hypothetical protein
MELSKSNDYRTRSRLKEKTSRVYVSGWRARERDGCLFFLFLVVEKREASRRPYAEAGQIAEEGRRVEGGARMMYAVVGEGRRIWWGGGGNNLDRWQAGGWLKGGHDLIRPGSASRVGICRHRVSCNLQGLRDLLWIPRV